MKKPESNTKQKVMRIFESKVDRNTPTDYELKKTANDVKGIYAEYKNEKDKNHQKKNTLKTQVTST